MKYRKLANTDLNVSAVCLGTMTYGDQNSQSEANEQLDYAMAQGINFIDTAELYPVMPRAETYSATEKIIGNWLKKTKKRNSLIIADKVTGRSGMNWIRPGEKETRLNKKQNPKYEIKQISLRFSPYSFIGVFSIYRM